jgi:putative photosynthetic complex assembly protein
MGQNRKPPPFPRDTLIIAGTVVLLSIMTAAAGRITGAANSAPTAAPVAARDLLFRDRSDGSVAVFDATNTSKQIDIIAPATNGFLRATMRGLARQRLRQDADREVPFHLTEWADGRLTLEDPTTGRRVEMEAFGITNEEVFASLLTAKEGS